MIVIEILNVEELVEKQSGQFAAMVGQLGRVDMEGRVEKVLIKQLKKSLQANGVEAKFSSVGSVKYTTYTNNNGPKS